MKIRDDKLVSEIAVKKQTESKDKEDEFKIKAGEVDKKIAESSVKLKVEINL